jgi:serine/threonine-protein kinase
MTADRWSRIEALFEEAADLASSERAAFLAEACAGDEALREEVEALLAADADADTYLGRLNADFVGPALESALAQHDALVGAAVGPYHVLRPLGHGGMGSVYVAERTDGSFAQTVALKLVRAGLAPTLTARFRAERQILARLEHPHIARLIDGGVAADGRPWLAMEYVEGEPITAYCDRKRLSVNERLALFEQVCEAVAYAHRNLVVHRDLKPSNILVTPEGEVKLLDFGIAKLMEEETPFTVAETRTGVRVMTPEYAAPEQVRGESVSTATDVYALGVLLYELLTGRRPYRLSTQVRHEIERAILEDEPTRPSTAVAEPLPEEQRATTPDTLSQARRADTATLRRRLAGDLDQIVLTALRKEPGRRYGSADAFADDVRRHLDGLPVKAQPDTVGYRARKFVRRHRGGVAAAALVVLALTVGLGAALWQADRAEAAAARAEAEAARAEAEVERSDAVAQFLIDLFAVTDPTQPEGGAPTADDMLRLGTDRAEADLADRPDLQATVYNVIASVYVGQGRYDEAEPLMKQALSLWETEQGLDNLDAAETQNNLGALYYRTGIFDEAERLLRAALATRTSLLPAGDPYVVEGKNNLGLVLMKQERLDEAAPLLEAALAGYREAKGDSSMEVAVALNNLGLVRNAQGDAAEAERLYAEALTRYRVLLGDGHPNVGIGLLNLGKVQAKRDALDEAMASAREADEVLTASMGAAHPATQATRAFLGRLLLRQGQYAEAESYLQDRYEALRARHGSDHPAVEGARQALVELYEQWGRPATAARYRASSGASAAGRAEGAVSG